MSNHTITYSCEQVYHIRLILQRNLCTIQGLLKIIESCGQGWPLDNIQTTAQAEIATCIRMMETGGHHA